MITEKNFHLSPCRSCSCYSASDLTLLCVSQGDKPVRRRRPLLFSSTTGRLLFVYWNFQALQVHWNVSNLEDALRCFTLSLSSFMWVLIPMLQNGAPTEEIRRRPNWREIQHFPNRQGE